MKLPKWLQRNNFYNFDRLSDDSEDKEAWVDVRDLFQVETEEEANLIGSKFVSGRHELHKVFIDLDVEHYYVPSSTEGHGHLYINVDLTREELGTLMGTLCKFGIVGDGWRYQIQARGENTFRLPGNKKKPVETLSNETDCPF